MADVNANIGVHIDTSAALAELKSLQRQLANFHASIAKGSAASALAQKNLQTNLLNAINSTGQFTAQMGLVRTSTESFTHALEKNKLGMRDYFRYAGGATKTFGRLFRQEFDTIQKVAEERVKKMQTQYIKMGRDANGAMKAMAITPTTLDMKNLGTQTAIAAQKQALFNQLVRQGSTNLLNFGKNTQWAGRQLMVGFTVPLAYLGTVASKTFMDMEKQAIRFRRVYGDMFTTTEDTTRALKEIELLAQSFTKYGVAVVDTMEMAADAAAMGKTGADLTAQVAQATRLAVLGSVEQQQALETTISLTNAFGIAAEDLTSKIDFLNSVENQTVVSIEDLTIAIPKAGPVVQQLGGDVEDLAFFLTAMKEGGINASEGANALKSGLASLINPSKKAAAMLNDLGININAIVEGNMGNVRETVIDFSHALDTLDPLNRARAIEQLFGKFQFSRLSTLFQNVTKDGTQAARVLDLAGASVEELAILSERELKAVEDSVGTNFKAAVEELKLTLAPIGKEFLKAVTPIVKVVGDVLEKFNGLSDGTKKFIVIATTVAGLIGPTLLMTFGLLANGAANIIKLFLAMRQGFMRLGGNSKLLADQTNYMTMEQLEATTVASSLNQAHARLTQSFTVEASAVRALRQAYIDATVAATAFARANPGMMAASPRGPRATKNNLSQNPKKFADGATYVPGTGNKDTVPAVLTPGEAVIPKRVAQDPRFQPIIDAMVNGKLQGFIDGTDDVQPVKSPFANSKPYEKKVYVGGPSQDQLRSSMGQVTDLVNKKPRKETDAEFAARSAALLARMQEKKKSKRGSGPTQKTHVGQGKEVSIAEILKSDNLSPDNRLKLQVFDEILRVNGESRTTLQYHDLMYDFNKDFNRSMQREPGVDAIQFLDEWKKLGPSKWAASGISQYDARTIDDIMYEIIKKETTVDPDNPTKKPVRTTVSDSYVAEIFEKRIPQEYPQVAESTTYKKMNALYNNLGAFRLGKGLKGTVAETESVLKKALDAGVIKNFRVSPTKKNEVDRQGRLITGSIYVTDNDGNIISLNRGGAGTRVTTPIEPINAKLQEIEKEANRRGAKSFVDRENALEEVAAKTKKSPVGNQEPEKYVRQLGKSSGYSFTPEPGIAGFYEKSDGSKVFVKPVMDYDAAIAEQRGTIIARDVHGLDSPLQTIKTMIDPSDAKGQRKLIVLESPYEPRFDPANMLNEFTEDDYFKQLVAATLRADSDVKKGNLSGNILADVGAAGVFETASGDRGYSANIRSMQEQAQILLGDKGTKFFREATADIPKNMTPEEYQRRVVAEIDRVLPRLQSTVDGFDLNPQERKVYEAMIARLKAGRNIDWKQFHALHSKVLVAKDESFQDKKTGAITDIEGKPKPTGVVPSSGKLKDNKLTSIPKGKRVVKTPKPRRAGKVVLPGLADAPEASTAPGIRIGDAAKQFRAEQNSLRRQIEKLEKIKVVEQKREIKQMRKQSEIRDNISKTDQANIKQKIKDQQDLNNKKTLDDKMQKQQSRMMKMQGVGMAAGMAASGAYMTGNTNIGNALMGLSVLATIGPMLANPVMAAVVGLTAVAGSIILLRRSFDKAQDSTMKMTESLGAGSKSIQDLAVFAGKVSATEIMDKRRQGQLNPFAIQTGKTTFGESFVKSETGKAMLANVGQSIKQGGNVNTQQQVLNQMVTAVTSGALGADQARSIIASIGSEIGDYGFALRVNAQLSSIVGPNGENLEKDPLKVRMDLMDASRKDLQKQSKILGNVAPGALTKTQGNFAIAGSAGAGALTGATIGAIAGPVGAAIGAGIGGIIGAGAGFLGQKGQQEKLGKASGATVAMQKMAIEQSQQMQDSLRLEYEQRIANAKAAGDTAKAIRLQGEFERANARLIHRNGLLLDNIANTYKGSSGAVRGALETGVEKQITDKYKGTAMADIAPLASQLLGDSKLSKEQQFTIKMQLASGQMDPMQIVNIMESFGNDKQVLTKVMNIVTQFGGTMANQAIAIAGTFVDSQGKPVKSVQTKFIMQLEKAKTPEEAQKILDFYGKVSATGNVLNTSVIVNLLLNNPGLAATLMATIDKITALKGPITVGVLTEVLNKKELDVLTEDLEYFNGLSDEEKKVYLQTLVTTISTVSKDDPAFKTWLTAEGEKWADAPPGTQLREYAQWNANRVTEASVPNIMPPSKSGGGSGAGGKRDTTYDDILNTLKRTRDATIKATGGAKELLRILGGKKDITIFNGIDQQLSKLGANKDFIDWVGGIDDAIRNKLIKITKQGVVSLTELGEASKKAFDEKQLGLYAAGLDDSINTSKDQRKAFVKLSNAGLDVNSILDIVQEGSLANAIATSKNSKELVKFVELKKQEKKQLELTSAMTEPKKFLEEINNELDRQFNYQKRLMDLQKRQTEAKISGDYIGAAILGQEQSFETSQFAREGAGTDFSGKVNTMQQALKILSGSKIKDKSQQALMQSSLNQGMLGLSQLGSFNPTYGYTPQFAGISPASAFGGRPTSTTDSSGSVYNIQMTVNGNNATADDIASQVMKKISLVSQRNNKSNSVGR